MIKHIVLFQLKAFDSESAKNEKLEEIKKGLESLPAKIDVLKSLSVGLNVNPNEKYDLALETTFDSLVEVDIYAKHPDHVAVGKILREVLEERACVDFEF